MTLLNLKTIVNKLKDIVEDEGYIFTSYIDDVTLGEVQILVEDNKSIPKRFVRLRYPFESFEIPSDKKFTKSEISAMEDDIIQGLFKIIKKELPKNEK